VGEGCKYLVRVMIEYTNHRSLFSASSPQISSLLQVEDTLVSRQGTNFFDLFDVSQRSFFWSLWSRHPLTYVPFSSTQLSKNFRVV